MTISRDLFLAILSMDSYNRGYAPGIQNLLISDSIGTATILTDASAELDANVVFNAGFYAIAYDVSGAGIDGLTGTVISYRGTDNISIFGSGDIRNGWFIGGGAQGDWAGAQAPLSIEFYKAIVGVDDNGQFESDPFDNNITLTGHSLGGGLAGYVASIYGRSAGIYDNMPFELASDITRERALAGESGSRGDVKDFVYGQYDVADIDRSNVRAMSASFEVLAALRLLGGQQTPVDTLDVFGSALLNPATERHMMDLLVNLIWARDNSGTEWQAAGVPLWNAYFDNEVAEAITGIAARKGENTSFAGTMGRMIAYSAIDEGERPFGDTAIWSMFDDAGELGSVLQNGAPSFFEEIVSLRV